MYCTRCCGEAFYNHGASWISYAKWCDLMVNHDADRRLCQYLIEPVCWWHFPFFISLEFCEALYIHLFLSTVMEMPFLLCQLMWPYGQPWCGQKALPISETIGLLMAFSCPIPALEVGLVWFPACKVCGLRHGRNWHNTLCTSIDTENVDLTTSVSARRNSW